MSSKSLYFETVGSIRALYLSYTKSKIYVIPATRRADLYESTLPAPTPMKKAKMKELAIRISLVVSAFSMNSVPSSPGRS